MHQYIRDWIELNNVGHEFGKHLEEDENGNTKSPRRRPADPNATRYNVYGQNCFWWATSIAIANDALSDEKLALIDDFNAGVGSNRFFADNQSLIDIVNAKKMDAKNIGRSWKERLLRTRVKSPHFKGNSGSGPAEKVVTEGRHFLKYKFNRGEGTAEWPKPNSPRK